MWDLIESYKDLRKALAGKKTYIMLILSGVLGTLQLAGYDIPMFIWPILGSLGMGAVKAAVDKWKDVEGYDTGGE